MKNQTVATGIAFILIALIFGIAGLQYPMGTVDQPGPAFFPVSISVFLLLLGVATAVKGLAEESAPIDYRLKNIGIISTALLGFAVASDYINMIAGIVILVTVSSFAANSYSIPRVVKIIVGLVVVAYIFKYLLGLNLPL